MNKQLLFVSIIVPCRNEEKYIGACLNSIIKQNYPKDRMEVLVVDGMSEDKTRDIVEKFKIQNSKFKIQILDNPRKIKSCALNIGIKQAKGDVVVIMDAHSGYAKNYISKCIEYLEKYRVDNVGGVIKTMPTEDSLVARAIAICLSHFFGAGGSVFRTGSKKPRPVDTVFGGCYRKEVFKKIGLFNENLVRSQDMEFNLRLKKAGGKILLAPDIVCYYYPKSNFWDFFLHNIQDGIWAVYPLKFVKMPFKFRHYIPFVFVFSLLATALLGLFSQIFFCLFLLILGLYFLANMYFSIKICLEQKNLRYLLVMPVAFAVRHFGYGLGSLWGIARILK